jgi:hypothetical protein
MEEKNKNIGVETANDINKSMDSDASIKNQQLVVDPKKSKLPFILLLIILLIAGGFVGWFLALNTSGSNNGQPVKKNGKQTVDISSGEVTKAIKGFDYININSDELLQNGLYNISNLSLAQKIETLGNIVYDKNRGIIATCGGQLITEISIDEMNNYIKEALDMVFTKEELEANAENSSYTYYVYEDNEDSKFYDIEGRVVSGSGDFWIFITNGKYYIMSNNCDGGDEEYILHKKLINAEKEDNKLYVYEKRAFYDIDYDAEELSVENEDLYSKVIVNYFKDYEKTKFIESLEGGNYGGLTSYTEQSSELSWDNYNTYKYTFIIKNGNYYFQKYELVK